MSKVFNGQKTARMEGDFVVFLIGMRFNKLWKVWKWWPVVMAMPRMLTELSKDPDSGLLSFSTWNTWRNVMVVQYWRSWEELHDYAYAREKAHLPAWQAFNKAVGGDGDVGIWHETYLVKAGQYENVYGNMPPSGLGVAGTLVDAAGNLRWAKGRMGED